MEHDSTFSSARVADETFLCQAKFIFSVIPFKVEARSYSICSNNGGSKQGYPSLNTAAVNRPAAGLPFNESCLTAL
jgi:hypothetical protein